MTHGAKASSGVAGRPPALGAPIGGRVRLAVAVLVSGVSVLVYLGNLRAMGAWDTVPARLLPYTLLRSGNVDFDEFPWLTRLDRPYFLVRSSDGHWVSQYPVFTGLLATPVALPAVWWLERNQIVQDDVRFRLMTMVTERVAAAVFSAVSVGLVFAAASVVTSPGLAAGIAVVYAVGTPTWSISSQALWQHGVAQMWLAGLVLVLLRPPTVRRMLLAGVCATAAVVTRPSMIVFLVAAAVFVWRRARGHVCGFAAPVVAGLGGLGLYNVLVIGLASGGQGLLFGVPSPVALAGLLVSPNRGLFVYVPAAVLAVPEIVRSGPGRAVWLRYLGFAVVGYWLLLGGWKWWWGGYSFGPRLLCDVLPALAVLAAPVVERWWASGPGRAALCLLAVWGMGVQVIGTYCDTRAWDQTPVSVDRAPARVWDVGDLQIVRALHGGWHGLDLLPALAQVRADAPAAFLRPLTDEQLAGRIVRQSDSPLRARAGQPLVVGLRVFNDSDVVWPAFSDFGYLNCVLGYRWWRGGAIVGAVTGRVDLPTNVLPGADVALDARVDTPLGPGHFDLEVDLVQLIDQQRGGFGGAAIRIPVVLE